MPGKKKNSHVFNTKKRTQNKQSQAKCTKTTKSPKPSKTSFDQTREKSVPLPEHNPGGNVMEKDIAPLSTAVQQAAIPCHIETEPTSDAVHVTDPIEPTLFVEAEPPAAASNKFGSVEIAKIITSRCDPRIEIDSDAGSLSDAGEGEEHNAVSLASSTTSSEAADDELKAQPEHVSKDFYDEPQECRFKGCVPSPGTAIAIIGPLTLPPALLPGYTNERVLAYTEPQQDTTPAYARPSMSYWLSNPAMKLAREQLTRGVPAGVRPTSKAKPLSDRRCFVPKELTEYEEAVSPPKSPVAEISDMVAHSTDKEEKQQLDECAEADSISVAASYAGAPVAESSNMAFQAVEGKEQQQSDEGTETAAISVAASDACAPVEHPVLGTDATFVSVSQALVQIQADVSSLVSEAGPTFQSTATNIKTTPVVESSCVESAHFHLLGAMPQNSGEEVFLWFDREPIAPIDADFSDDEDDDAVVETHGPLSKASRYDSLGLVAHTELAKTARKTSDSDKSSTLMFEDQASTPRSVSISSRTSQSSADTSIEIDKLFLGNTCARDLFAELDADSNGLISKEQLARTWLLCVAAEHANWRETCSVGANLWVPFITIRDADRALELHVQRRAKLGNISLRDLFKKLRFDEEGMVAMDALLHTLHKTSLAS